MRAARQCAARAHRDGSHTATTLRSDLKTMKQSPPEGVSASPLGDENLLVWGGTVIGPDDTPWEGGIFSMRLTFTDQYPDKPPRVRFTSEMVRAPPQRKAPLSRPSAARARDRPTAG
jgi:ubiquitin-protein ligase